MPLRKDSNIHTCNASANMILFTKIKTELACITIFYDISNKNIDAFI